VIGGIQVFACGEAEFTIEEPEGALDAAEDFRGEVDDEGEEDEADEAEEEGGR
jgi:hypothetical protein